jgi:hypothetical protein
VRCAQRTHAELAQTGQPSRWEWLLRAPQRTLSSCGKNRSCPKACIGRNEELGYHRLIHPDGALKSRAHKPDFAGTTCAFQASTVPKSFQERAR